MTLQGILCNPCCTKAIRRVHHVLRTSATSSLRKSWPVFASSEVRGIVATLPVFVMSHQILCDIFSESPTLCTGVLRFGLQHLHYPMLSDSESAHFCPLSLCPPNCAYRVVSVATLIESRWPMSSSTLSQCSKAGALCGNLSSFSSHGEGCAVVERLGSRQLAADPENSGVSRSRLGGCMRENG